jgi:acyl-CoA synthetase (NDP forming)
LTEYSGYPIVIHGVSLASGILFSAGDAGDSGDGAAKKARKSEERVRTLKEVMESENLVVIGASQNPLKPGAMLLEILRSTGFQGKVAGVNPAGGEVYGVRLYSRLDEVPFEVDLAALVIPPAAVPGALAECARRGVKGVVILSEGFAESGDEGRRYQEEILNILRSTGMRGFGPNTLGVVNTATGLTTSYFSNEQMLRPGSIGFAAQSGIFVGALLRYLGSIRELCISKGIGLGNKVDVDESDVLGYFRDDEQTQTVGIYLEDIRDGRRFLEVARDAARRKPVLLLKGGRTPQGARASASHTASLAVDDAVLDGALRQAGVLRVGGVEEMVGALMGFEWMPLPRGNRIALVTFSGALAIMSVDKAIREGLDIAQFSDATRERLSGVIATPAKAQNPIDIFPDMLAHGFEKTVTEILGALLDDEGVHGIMLISFAAFGVEMYHPIVELIHAQKSKPLFVTLLGAQEDVRITGDYLLDQRVPFFPFPEMGVRVFSHMWQYARRSKQWKR